MPESAEEVYARVIGQVGEHGQLPMPPGSPVGRLPLTRARWCRRCSQPPVEAEQPRSGEGDRPCSCETGEPASTHLAQRALDRRQPRRRPVGCR